MSRAIAFILVLVLACTAHATPLHLRSSAYELQVLVDGQPARSFWHEGNNWVLGRLGDRYTLRVVNHSNRRIEAVVSVDGRDVIDGQPGDTGKRGYLVEPYGVADIDGWRISREQAAAFRFSSVANSYAQQMGNGRDVGVIGVAIFEERRPPVVYVPRPHPDYDYREMERQSSAGEPADMSADSPRASAPAPTPSATVPPASESSGPAHYAQEKPAKSRSGLGTEYGEAVDSRIYEVSFERASHNPSTVIGCRYNDRGGLIAMGIDVDRISESGLRSSADPFPGYDRSFAPPPAGWRP